MGADQAVEELKQKIRQFENKIAAQAEIKHRLDIAFENMVLNLCGYEL